MKYYKSNKKTKPTKRLLRKARIIMAVIGSVLIYCGISSSDYYAMELGQPEPASVWKMINIGLLLLIPSFIHLILNEKRERKYVQNR